MKKVLTGSMKLLLFVTVLNSAVFAGAQSKQDAPFYVVLDFNMGGNYYFGSGNYSYKTIEGFDDPVFCLDFSNGPFSIDINYFSKTPETKTLNISLYVPQKAYSDAYLVCSFFHYYAPVSGGPFSYNLFDGIYPSFDDLEKIKEFTMETNPQWDDYWKNYNGRETILWDGKTDPAFTDGKEYPVQDNVFVFVTDAQTGEPVADYWYDDVIRNPLETYRRVNRYTGRYLHKYTAKEKSIVCDIYFTSQLPVTKAVPFLGNSCMWQWADYTKAKEGIEKVVQSLLLYSNEALEAYQVFDNLSPDNDGVYHLTWEIKDLRGNFFDVAKMTGDPDFLDIGLYVEGDGQETYNLGLPEYGGTEHKSMGDYSPVIWSRILPPRPLNPDEPNFYPDFTITNDGVLTRYNCSKFAVIIPKTVKKIDDNAFAGCPDVSTIIGQDGLNSIGNNAFTACTELRTISLPKTVTSIGTRAFAGCSLMEVRVEWRTPLSVPDDIFEGGINTYCTLYVPTGTKALYRAAKVWKDFETIVEYTPVANETVEAIEMQSLKVNASNGVLYISGLQSGKPLCIYNMGGQLVHQSIAKAETEQIPFTASGIYIVATDSQSIKIAVE